jgi:hypothetical protein
MTQDEMTREIGRAREGATLTISYDSPRGERRFGIRIVAVKRNPEGRVQRVSLERGTAVWMYVQRGKLPDGDTQWCFFQPNPYPIYDLAVENA